MRTKRRITKIGLLTYLLWILVGCKVPQTTPKTAQIQLPEQFDTPLRDSSSVATLNWRDYFQDPYLNQLIDSALRHNQELNIVLQELAISQSEVLEREGEYLPFVDLGAGIGAEKPGRYTRAGAVEHNLEIEEGKEFPEPLGDFSLQATAAWEVDIWRKLRNAKDVAQLRYLAASEGRNFLVTQLIAEIAEAYYELIALDNLLIIVNRNVTIQQEALEKMKLLKASAKANQLAVNRFKAQLLNTQNQQYALRQRITQTENQLYFLTGSYPTDTLRRNTVQLMRIQTDSLRAGIPSQLLEHRPDVRQAALQVEAAKLDIAVAKANFYPQLDLRAGLGFQAFNPRFLLRPESMLLDAAGDLVAPLINRKALQAQYKRATAEQIQAVYQYEQTVLRAYTEVLNQLAKLDNYAQSLKTKQAEVRVLSESVEIANSLFRYAKADYVEVLLTQEEVLDAEMELVETRLQQLQAKVGLYKALGGGWE